MSEFGAGSFTRGLEILEMFANVVASEPRGTLLRTRERALMGRRSPLDLVNRRHREVLLETLPPRVLTQQSEASSPCSQSP